MSTQQTTRASVFDKEPPLAGTSRLNRMNMAAATFLDSIINNLGEDILPGYFGTRFKPSDAEFYVAVREWISGLKPADAFYYEEYFHQHYWPGLQADYPLLLLVGGEGVGKSTLLRYYFDCYIYHRQGSKVCITDTEVESMVTDHVVLYSNLRRGIATEVVKSDLFVALRDGILRRFPDIASEAEYGMWERRARWKDKHHEHARRNYPTDDAYKASFVSDWIKNPEMFVTQALWYLGAKRTEAGKRAFFVTVILDNLDQQDTKTLIEMVDLVVRWLGPAVDAGPYAKQSSLWPEHAELWKVILPLRVQSFASLKGRLDPINRKHIIPLGSLKYAPLMAVRAAATANAVRRSNKMVDVDVVVEDGAAPVYAPWAAFQAADAVECMLTTGLDVPLSSGKVTFQSRQVTRELVEEFCSGSVRRLLRLRKRVAMSIPFAIAVQKQLQSARESSFIPDYVFIDGALTGPRDHFDETEDDNDFLNLFNCTKTVPSPYSLLVGPFLLYILRKGQRRCSELVQQMEHIGFFQSEIQEVLDAMSSKGMIRLFPVDTSDDQQIVPLKNIIEAFVRLLAHAAYIDNMATVTPVEERLRLKMVRTSSGAPKDFEARVHTAITFLQQIRDDEYAVSSYNAESSRYIVSKQEFCAAFNRHGFPSIYRKAACAYRTRLEELRKEKRQIYLSLRERWDDLEKHPILSIDEHAADTPLRASDKKMHHGTSNAR